eukprot:GHVL01042985.1.p1 GENE.GHVL01042985.1~~GHVL01042985.1.p1  ORF type:complete len:736 (+),score=106.92 GHVL01042985.1:528-2735(+)
MLGNIPGVMEYLDTSKKTRRKSFHLLHDQRRTFRFSQNGSIPSRMESSTSIIEEGDEVDIVAVVDEIFEKQRIKESMNLADFASWMSDNDCLLSLLSHAMHEEIWRHQGFSWNRSKSCASPLKSDISKSSLRKAVTSVTPQRQSSNPSEDTWRQRVNLKFHIASNEVEKLDSMKPKLNRNLISKEVFDTIVESSSDLTTINELTLNSPSIRFVRSETESYDVLANREVDFREDDPRRKYNDGAWMACPSCHEHLQTCTSCNFSTQDLNADFTQQKIEIVCLRCNNSISECPHCGFLFQHIVEMIDREQPIKEGFLQKPGKHSRQWKNRYYVQIDNVLYYYRHQRDTHPQGLLFLEGCFVEIIDSRNRIAAVNRYGLSIAHTSGNYREHLLFAKSEVERDEWLDALRWGMKQQSIEQLYQLMELIGKGNFSVVHRGISRRSGKQYAVKIIDKHRLKNAEKDLLRSEMAIMRLLRHPHVIHMHEILDTRDVLYIVMELVKGGELFDQINQLPDHRMPEASVQRIIAQLLNVIYYLHSCGILHRDIKPENILLTEHHTEQYCDIRLTDFGLATFIGPNEKLKHPCGTRVYVAPEVMAMTGYGKPADLWSVGVVMYQLLCGSLPFHVDKNYAMKCTDSKNFVLEMREEAWKDGSVSSEARDLVHRFLTHDSNQRITCKDAVQHGWIKTISSPIRKQRTLSSLNRSQSLLSQRPVPRPVNPSKSISPALEKLMSPKNNKK